MTLTVDWDQIGSDGSQTLSENGQDVTVTVSTPQNSQGKEWSVENGMLKNWDVSRDSQADIRFDQEVENVKFTLLDVDRLDEITIMTKDADGNTVEVDFEVTGVHSVDGNAVTGTQTNAPGPGADNPDQDIEVCIPGPVMTFWIVLDDGPERDYSGTVAVSDISFDLPSNLDGYVEGTSGDDTIDADYVGDPEGDRVDANDEILLGEGPQDDIILAGAGDDDVTAGDGDDEIYGGAGDDDIASGAGEDLVYGGAGADTIDGGADDDTLIGGGVSFDGKVDFNDLATGEVVNGQYVGEGLHIYSADADHPVMAFDSANPTGGDDDLASNNLGKVLILSEDGDSDDPDDNASGGTFVFEFDGPASVENITLLDVERAATIRLYDENDNLIDTITTGTTADGGQLTQDIQTDGVVRMELTMDGSGALDNLCYTLDGNGHDEGDVIDAGAGDDYVDGMAGNDSIDGGSGNDTLEGSEGDDRIFGNAGDDTQFGGAGNDVLGGADFGDDTFYGGTGDDMVEASFGDDEIYGGTGNDNLWASSDDDLVYGGAGDDSAYGGQGQDTVYGDDGDDTLSGGSGEDTVYGGAGDDTIDGDTLYKDDTGPAGADTIYGGSGDDAITGGGGSDDIYGGDDADVIIGGAGDTVDGGAGGNDHDVLDLTGQGPFIVTGPGGVGEPVIDSNGNGLDGQIQFLDDEGNPNGEIIDFTEIEEILGDRVVNADPDADPDAYSANEDDDPAEIGNVLDNDDDPDGDALTVGAVDGDPNNVGVPVAGDNGGLVTINENGTVTFDPNGDFEGLAVGETAETTVTYTIDDGNGGSDTTTVTITVAGENDAPEAEDNAYTLTQDEAAGDTDGSALNDDTGDGVDSDPDGDTLRITSITNGTDTDSVDQPFGATGQPMTVTGTNGGIVTLYNAGRVDFDANGEFDFLAEGETATTSVDYTISDNNGGTDTATVTFTVTGVNDGPVAVDNGYVTTASETIGDIDGNVLTDNTGEGVDSDPEGDPLAVVGVGATLGGVGTAVAGNNGGLFTISADGSVDFDANGEFDDLGLNDSRTTSVEYTISDGNGGTDTAVATFTVGGINDGTVNGTDGDDIINPGYVDADGDIADGNDAILPGDTGNDDLIEGYDGDDTINAGDGNDEVYGGADDDLINGNQGNDTLYGDDGEDTVNGGLGNDTVFGGEGDDNLNGQDGHDTIDGGDGNDDIDGGAGNDTLLGGDGDDVIEGSEGEDVIDGGEGDDDIWGGLDDDTITGGRGSDTVGGGDGNDVIDTGNHVDPAADYDYPGPTIPGLPIGDNDADPSNDLDTVFGGAGDDIITTGDDDDVVDGGTGNDYIDVGIDDDTVTAGDGDDTVIGSQGEDSIDGGDGDDVLYGGLDTEVLNLPDSIDPAPDDNRDSIDGGAGNDTIFGRDDDDVLAGGTGDDVIYGGIDEDTITGGEDDDTLFGDDGNDSISGQTGSDTVYGGDGDDIVGGGISDGNDVVYGDDGNDTVLGGVGDDTLYGGDGNDTLASDRGDDSLFGGDGDDSIQGGVGDDTIEGGDGDDIIRANAGSDTVDGGDGDDTIITYDPTAELPDQDYPGDGLVADPDPTDDIDVVDGGAGNDVIRTGDDADTIFGGTGDDQIDGGVDNDQITGGDGADDIKGGLGSDTIFGGTAGDVVTGGEDPDDSDIDVLDLTGSNVDRIEYVDGDPEAGTVFFQDGSTMTFTEIENVIPCFTPGTTIATPRGERLVEELKVGDKIITRDNGIQEIAWVGHKQMDGKQLAANPHLKPVLIKAGSLGHGLPERDMLVSPNHRVLVASELTQLYFEETEVLAAAKHMTGADGIHAVDVMATTYVHFMFERHEVVLSNGAWTESFQPGDYSLKGIGNGQRNEIFELFPELATKSGLEGYQSARKALKKHEARLLMK